MQKTTGIVTVALMAFGLSVVAGPATAGGDNHTQQGARAQQSSPQSTQFSDKEIKKYAKTRKKVVSTSTKWQKKINDADDQKTKNQYRSQMDKALIKAVKQSGLSTQEFNKITRAAQRDPELAKRIQAAATP